MFGTTPGPVSALNGSNMYVERICAECLWCFSLFTKENTIDVAMQLILCKSNIA